MRLLLHHLFSRETETLEGTPEQLDAQLAELFPEQAVEVDPDDGLDELIDHINHELQGIEIEPDQVEELVKTQTPPSFPKLGIQGRRETPFVHTEQELAQKRLSMAHAGVNAHPAYKDQPPAARAMVAQAVADQLKDTPGGHVLGAISAAPNTAVGYVRSQNLLPARYGPNTDIGTKNHEDFHQNMRLVEAKHGWHARVHLSNNLLNAIPVQFREHAIAYHDFVTGGGLIGKHEHPEEVLARIFNYANDSSDRERFHAKLGHSSNERIRFGTRMKRALQALRAASEVAHEKWLERNHIERSKLHKDELGNKDPAPIVTPEPVKQKRSKKLAGPNLVAVHNLTGNGVLHAHQLGGLAAPSLAITHKDHPLHNFGDISLVAHHDLVDPKTTPVFEADIYSPRHPRAKYRSIEKEVKKVKGWLGPYMKKLGEYHGDIDEQIERGGAEAVLDHHRIKRALGMAYLEHLGKPVPIQMRNKRLEADWLGHPIMQSFRNDSSIKHDSQCGYEDTYRKQFSDVAKQALRAWANETAKAAGEDQSFADSLFDSSHDYHWNKEEDQIHFGRFGKLVESMKKVGEREPDSSAMEDMVEQRMKEENPEEFKKWAMGHLKPMEGDPYIPKMSAMGNWRKTPYNLYTVLKEMTRKIRQGENFDYGLGTARAAGAKRFKSLEQMAASRHKIVPKAQFDKLKDAMDERFSKLVSKLSPYHPNGNGFGMLGATSEAIGESFKRGKSLHQELKNSGFEGVPLHIQEEVRQFAHDLLAMPTEYFEAKPQRAVHFHEFKGAVVPVGTHPDVIKVLREAGLQIEHYQKDDAAARTMAIQKIAGDHQLLLSEDDLDAPALKKVHKSEDEGHTAVEDMHGFRPQLDRAFMAARFLTGNQSPPDRGALRQCLLEHEGDVEAAALAVYGLPVTPENLKALRAVQGFKSLSKSEPSYGKVLAAHPDAEEVAKKLDAAISKGHVKPVELGGVHSAGTLLVSDHNKHWLMKPGAGGPGPAAGAQEQPATDSEREAAFYHVAKAWRLGDDLPRADLVTMNGKQYAAIEMLPFDWKNFSKVQEKDPSRANKALEPYRRTGQLHQWALLDAVLGNPDRHGQNEMISPEDQIKLIDHGSAFAGPEFDPAHDHNSFIPYYLRAHVDPTDWKKWDAERRCKMMPTVSHAVEHHLRLWLESLDAAWAADIMTSYKVDPHACMARLDMFKRSTGTIDGVINRFWVTV